MEFSANTYNKILVTYNKIRVFGFTPLGTFLTGDALYSMIQDYQEGYLNILNPLQAVAGAYLLARGLSAIPALRRSYQAKSEEADGQCDETAHSCCAKKSDLEKKLDEK
ncbi:hypothetical protein HY772_07705 [Candidatus Woesearchaeota archaeon]|nr:hypothetical protein [Candidatus Woesearchaeota archaeon]